MDQTFLDTQAELLGGATLVALALLIYLLGRAAGTGGWAALTLALMPFAAVWAYHATPAGHLVRSLF